MRILLVDDERDNRDSMKMLLQLQGHDVELAENGKEGVERAAAAVPDVVFMDMKMPVMDGLTATRLLRSQPMTRRVPIICISAYLGEADWRDRAFEAGCNECLPNPSIYVDLR